MKQADYRRGMVEAMMSKDAGFTASFTRCTLDRNLLPAVVQGAQAAFEECRVLLDARGGDAAVYAVASVVRRSGIRLLARVAASGAAVHARAPTGPLNEIALIRLSGMDISTIRRYFKQHLNATPLGFHRRIRLNFARELIEQGNDYLSACYECGYVIGIGISRCLHKTIRQTPGAFYERN